MVNSGPFRSRANVSEITPENLFSFRAGNKSYLYIPYTTSNKAELTLLLITILINLSLSHHINYTYHQQPADDEAIVWAHLDIEYNYNIFFHVAQNSTEHRAATP